MSETRENAAGAGRRQSGPLRDLWDLYVSPGALFGRLPQRPRSGVALLLLLLAHVGVGFLVVETGVPDYETDVLVQRDLSRKLRHFTSDEDIDELATAVEAIEKQGVFAKLALRLNAYVGRPLVVLCEVGILSGALFAIAALSAGRPNYRLLACVVIFANLVEVPRLALETALVRQVAASRVETSLAVFLNPAESDLVAYVLLRQVDPFAVWFWALVAYGTWKTGQASRRTALAAVIVLAFFAVLAGAAADLPLLVDLGALVPEPT